MDEGVTSVEKLNSKGKALLATLVCWSLVSLWVGLVFYLSYQKGEQSTYLSSGIAEEIIEWIPQLAWKYSFDEVHIWTRKAAHVFVFLILGMMTEIAGLISADCVGRNWKKASAVVVLVCGLVAVVSECVKVNIPGRHLSWGEAALNLMCAICGMGVVLLRCRVKRRPRKG